MRKNILLVLAAALLTIAGYLLGNSNATITYAGPPNQGSVPKSYGRLVTAIPTRSAPD